MKIYETCKFCGNRFVGSFKRKHCYDKECINKRANISYHKCKNDRKVIQQNKK